MYIINNDDNNILFGGGGKSGRLRAPVPSATGFLASDSGIKHDDNNDSDRSTNAILATCTRSSLAAYRLLAV